MHGADASPNRVQKSGELSPEQLAYYKSEDYGPDCLMELRFLDTEHRQEGARYIADERLPPRESVVLARAIKERQRRPEAAEGFSEQAGDCLAFKFFRDAEETRTATEKEQFIGARRASCLLLLVIAHRGCAHVLTTASSAPSTLLERLERCNWHLPTGREPRLRPPLRLNPLIWFADKGVKVAVTDGARDRLESLRLELEQEAQKKEAVVASIEVARLNRDELGSRLVPLAGPYLQTTSEVQPSVLLCLN